MYVFILGLQETPLPELNFGWLMLRMLIFLALVLVLIYFVLRKVLPMLMQTPHTQNRAVKIIDRVPIDQKRSLLVVEVQDRIYLLGSAEGQINVLMELDRDKMQFATTERKASSFAEVLKKTLSKEKSSGTPA